MPLDGTFAISQGKNTSDPSVKIEPVQSYKSDVLQPEQHGIGTKSQPVILPRDKKYGWASFVRMLL